MDLINHNIYNDIKELSDISFQRKLWLNQNNDTGLISSYAEVMCRLFDDNGIDDFIDIKAYKIGLSNELILELNKLRIYLIDYNQRESDEEIINDPEWIKIVEQAKIVLQKWDSQC